MNFDFPVMPPSQPAVQVSASVQPQFLPTGADAGLLLGLTQFDAAMMKAMASPPQADPTTNGAASLATMSPVASAAIPVSKAVGTLPPPALVEAMPAASATTAAPATAPLPVATGAAESVMPIDRPMAGSTAITQPDPAVADAPTEAPALPQPTAPTSPVRPAVLPPTPPPPAALTVAAETSPEATAPGPLPAAPRSDTGNRARSVSATRRTTGADEISGVASAAPSQGPAIPLDQLLPMAALAVNGSLPETSTADAPPDTVSGSRRTVQPAETPQQATQQQLETAAPPPQPTSPAGPVPMPAIHATAEPAPATLVKPTIAPPVAAIATPTLVADLPTPNVIAALPPASSPRATDTAPVTQVAPVLVSLLHAPDGTQRLTLRLDPPELGHVQIRIERPSEGPARVEIIVERQETLNLLVRDQVQLQRALDQAGVPPDGRSVIIHIASAEPALRSESGLAAAFGTGSASTGDASYGASRQGGGPAQQHEAGFVGEDEGEFAPVASPNWTRGGLDITA